MVVHTFTFNLLKHLTVLTLHLNMLSEVSQHVFQEI